MLDEPTAIVDGYEAYFSFSRKKSGYSGETCIRVPRSGKGREFHIEIPDLEMVGTFFSLR